MEEDREGEMAFSRAANPDKVGFFADEEGCLSSSLSDDAGE